MNNNVSVEISYANFSNGRKPEFGSDHHVMWSSIDLPETGHVTSGHVVCRHRSSAFNSLFPNTTFVFVSKSRQNTKILAMMTEPKNVDGYFSIEFDWLVLNLEKVSHHHYLHISIIIRFDLSEINRKNQTNRSRWWLLLVIIIFLANE